MTDEHEQEADLRGEQSREAEAAQEGVVERDLDPETEVGDPAEPVAEEPGDAEDDHVVDDEDDDAPMEDV